MYLYLTMLLKKCSQNVNILQPVVCTLISNEHQVNIIYLIKQLFLKENHYLLNNACLDNLKF